MDLQPLTKLHLIRIVIDIVRASSKISLTQAKRTVEALFITHDTEGHQRPRLPRQPLIEQVLDWAYCYRYAYVEDEVAAQLNLALAGSWLNTELAYCDEDDTIPLLKVTVDEETGEWLLHTGNPLATFLGEACY